MLIIHIWLQVCLQKVHWKYTQGSGNVHRVVLQSIFKRGLTVCYIHLQVDKMQNTAHLYKTEGGGGVTLQGEVLSREGAGETSARPF